MSTGAMFAVHSDIDQAQANTNATYFVPWSQRFCASFKLLMSCWFNSTIPDASQIRRNTLDNVVYCTQKDTPTVENCHYLRKFQANLELYKEKQNYL